MRHCCGCKYMGECYCFGCCNYYLVTGNRRPSKFGQKCPVKVLRNGYVLPENYEAWCAEWDAKLAEKEQKKQERMQKQLEREENIRALLAEAHESRKTAFEQVSGNKRNGSVSYDEPRAIDFRKAPVISNARGRAVQWDVDYAFSLYVSGYYICDIEDIMQLDGAKLRSYISNHGWHFIENRNRNFKRADIPFERAQYAAWKKAREEKKLSGALNKDPVNHNKPEEESR